MTYSYSLRMLKPEFFHPISTKQLPSPGGSTNPWSKLQPWYQGEHFMNDAFAVSKSKV